LWRPPAYSLLLLLLLCCCCCCCCCSVHKDLYVPDLKLKLYIKKWMTGLDRRRQLFVHWRRSVVKYGDEVSHVKPSNCFRRLEKLGPRFTFHFLTQVFHPWWCETCRVIKQQLWVKEYDSLGVKTYSDPSYIFSGDQHPQPPGSTPSVPCLRESSTWTN